MLWRTFNSRWLLLLSWACACFRVYQLRFTLFVPSPPPLPVCRVQGLGLLLGVITMVPKTAQTLASVVMMSMVLTGGFFVTTLPSWCAWMRRCWSSLWFLTRLLPPLRNMVGVAARWPSLQRSAKPVS